MKITILCLLAGYIVLTFSSCTDRVYAPALYHQDIAYQPKPASFDSVKSASYASGGIGLNTNPTFNDALFSAQFNLSQGYVFNNFNLAYGAFGVVGDYQNSTITRAEPLYFNDKFFGAVGGRASANFFVNNGNVDFRVIGIEMAYSHEFGDYSDFRKLASQSGQSNFYTDNRVDLLTAGLTSEVLWRAPFNHDVRHGVRLFIGQTFGYNNITETYYQNSSQNYILRNVFVKGSYFIQFQKYIATIEAGNGVLLRFGYTF